jgi:RHS repeat-associated protein
MTSKIHISNYPPFGVLLQNRNFTSEGYRYGFNGQEKDDEIKGENNSVNFAYRMHDPRLARFLSIDPITHLLPHNSPYGFAENDVIRSIDIEGGEKKIVIDDGLDVKVYTGAKLKQFADDELINEIKKEFLIKNSTMNFKVTGVRSETFNRGLYHETVSYLQYSFSFDTYDVLGDPFDATGTFEIPFSSVTHGGISDIPLAVITELLAVKIVQFYGPLFKVFKNTSKALIKGDLDQLFKKAKAAEAGDLSALAEIKVAKSFVKEGKQVEFVKELPGVTNTADLIVDGVSTEVKRLSGLGSNFASDLKQAAKQVGDNGQVIIVRPANASYTIKEAEDFIKNFKTDVKNVTFKVVDESSLPEAFGKK